MRRTVTKILLGLLIVIAVGALASVALTRSALAAAKEGPSPMCLEARKAAQLRAGALPLLDKDLIVAKAANFAMGAPPVSSVWWHVRGAIIQGAYRTFWFEASRAAVFSQVASRMRRCPPRDVP
jgi:hypothetical protein